MFNYCCVSALFSLPRDTSKPAFLTHRCYLFITKQETRDWIPVCHTHNVLKKVLESHRMPLLSWMPLENVADGRFVGQNEEFEVFAVPGSVRGI